MILLVRHGRTRFNAEGRLQGRTNSPLTAEGEAHARSQAALLRTLFPTDSSVAIVSSPLPRATATARIIATELDLAPVSTDNRLAEVSLGEWDGLRSTDVSARWPGSLSPNLRMAWARHCPGGERYEDAVARAQAFLQDRHDRHVIAVSHGIFGSLLRGLHAKLARDEMLSLPVPHDAVFRLEGGTVERFNCG